MKKNIYYIFLFLFNFSFVSAQINNNEYFGTIKLNDSSLISYKLVLQINENNINGYSITDIGGEHETKSFLKGSIDENNKDIFFTEYGIVYTKSSVTKNDFCFIHFTGKISNHRITGSFKGLYQDGTQCIDGEIRLTEFKKVIKKINKIDKKIQRNVLISKEKKERVNLTKDLDSINMNLLKSGKNLNVFSKDEFITLVLYDSGKEDGDIIKLKVNDKIILDNYTIESKKKLIKIPLLQEKNLITIEAITEGYSPPNTVKIELSDSENFTHTRTILKKREIASITIYKTQ